jgi:hypothetical protein
MINFLQDKTFYYSFLLFANFLICFSLIPLVYETTMLKMTINIPYFTLLCFGIAFFIFIFVSLMRKYLIHAFIYTIAFICVIILFINKLQFDKNNINIQKKVVEIEYKNKNKIKLEQSS